MPHKPIGPRNIRWKSSLCLCHGLATVEENPNIKIYPCDYEHTPWAILIGSQALHEKLTQLNKSIPGKYISRTLANYRRWIGSVGVFMRLPEVVEDPEAVSAEQAMYDYETHGVSLPGNCSNPAALSDYLQGKANREFHITNWLEDFVEWDGKTLRMLFREEFLGVLGMDVATWENVFDRKPDLDLFLESIEMRFGLLHPSVNLPNSNARD